MILNAWNRDPLAVALLIATASTLVPLGRAWVAGRGLPLRSALAWGFLAIALAILAQFQGLFEDLETGRPLSNHWQYLACLCGLAGLISVFNARTPGGGAWAILMALLVVVFLVPWLEGSGLAHGRGIMDRLRLDMPWSLFFALVAIAGVANYLPTHFGPAAAIFGLAMILEMAGLLLTGWPPGRRGEMWAMVPLLMAASGWMAQSRSRRRKVADEGLARLWLWFRDHWGAVWALRILDRFNRAAESASWPVRLTWQGPRGPEGQECPDVPEAARKTLVSLLRRFAPEAILNAKVEG